MKIYRKSRNFIQNYRIFVVLGSGSVIGDLKDRHDLKNRSVNGELWEEILNRWLSHYLYGEENGIENMFPVTVQSNVDGSYLTYESWGDFAADTFAYDKTVNPDVVSHVDAAGLREHGPSYMKGKDDFGRKLLR